MAKKLRIDPIEVRKAAGENQSQFWSRFGITQSGGSRYENGRSIPRSVKALLALATGRATVEQLQNGELAARV